MARVVLARAASAALAALDFLLADAILDALSELERDPELGHQLRGRLQGLRSYRVQLAAHRPTLRRRGGGYPATSGLG